MRTTIQYFNIVSLRVAKPNTNRTILTFKAVEIVNLSNHMGLANPSAI